MDALLASIVYIAASMIDPLTLLIAFGIGMVAARIGDPVPRWMMILAGAAAMVLVLSSLAYRLSVLDGAPFRFRWFEHFVSCALQVTLMCQIVGWWRRRRVAPME